MMEFIYCSVLGGLSPITGSSQKQVGGGGGGYQTHLQQEEVKLHRQEYSSVGLVLQETESTEFFVLMREDEDYNIIVLARLFFGIFLLRIEGPNDLFPNPPPLDLCNLHTYVSVQDFQRKNRC